MGLWLLKRGLLIFLYIVANISSRKQTFAWGASEGREGSPTEAVALAPRDMWLPIYLGGRFLLVNLRSCNTGLMNLCLIGPYRLKRRQPNVLVILWRSLSLSINRFSRDSFSL